ncbi:hypothetical protein [Ureaplasma ceti]
MKEKYYLPNGKKCTYKEAKSSNLINIELNIDYNHPPLSLCKGKLINKREHIYERGNQIDVGVDYINNDQLLNEWNNEISDLFDSVYIFPSQNELVFEDGQSIHIDNDGLKKIQPKLLSLIKLIVNRLNEINRGDYYVCDDSTWYIEELLEDEDDDDEWWKELTPKDLE